MITNKQTSNLKFRFPRVEGCRLSRRQSRVFVECTCKLFVVILVEHLEFVRTVGHLLVHVRIVQFHGAVVRIGTRFVVHRRPRGFDVDSNASIDAIDDAWQQIGKLRAADVVAVKRLAWRRFEQRATKLLHWRGEFESRVGEFDRLHVLNDALGAHRSHETTQRSTRKVRSQQLEHHVVLQIRLIVSWQIGERFLQILFIGTIDVFEETVSHDKRQVW